jgi:choline-sulfatase
MTLLSVADLEAGYETGLVGKMHLGGDRQFAGFDERPYGDLLGMNGHQFDPVSPERRSFTGSGPIANENAGITEYPESQHQERIVVGESMAFLREHRHASPDQPWFLCASFSRPHDPYTTPPRHFERYWSDGERSEPDGVTDPPVEAGEGTLADHPVTRANLERDGDEPAEVRQRARAAYFANVDYLDELLGDFLALLDREGFLEDTIVVYASDHGDMIGEHGMWRKGIWYEGSTRVPLLVEFPEHREEGDVSGTDVSTPVSLVDLYPTLCGLADVDAPADLNGVDLSGAVRGDGEPDRGPVFVDNLRPRWGEGSEYRMVRDGRYKYVRFRDRPEVLVDLAADPLERDNRAADPSGEDAAALDRLRGLVEETLDFETVQREYEDDAERYRRHSLGVPTGTAGNVYRLNDDTYVDADLALTKPDILVRDPEGVVEDWPDEE